MEGHWVLDIYKRRLNDPSIPDRAIREFIRQCPSCQEMSQLRIPLSLLKSIITRRFTCASYYPFEVIHLDHIGPLPADKHGNKFILVLTDAFSRWVEALRHLKALLFDARVHDKWSYEQLLMVQRIYRSHSS